VNHSTLTGKTQEQIRREVIESKTEIERQTGRPVTLFCYPSGKKEDFQEKAKAVIKEAGYLGAVTGLRGTFSVSDDLFEMRRYILDPDLRIEELVSRTSTAVPRRL
jgi:peptidoglycan/xylan/chitin deacetylase (PgdA/CDA1 family)